MVIEKKTFHITIEFFAIFISTYFIILSHLFSKWKKYSLIIICVSVIIIDIYAILSWVNLVNFLPKKLFHLTTEALAIPAGFILIYLSQENINNKLLSRLLLVMGISNFFIDGYLILTWL